ncbi:MAG TPA: Trm112 family protein [Chloroflexia bacterium]|nr:Trm112 family protein [Chloroflexia bacterium]
MDLYSILVCPVCKSDLTRGPDSLTCQACNRVYPIVNGIPVLLPDGSVPATEYQHQLLVREDYGPWVPRLVMQSLTPDAIILEIGAGNMTLDLPNVIRMDVTLTPYVDVVADAHALPFRPDTFSFVFSLAVIEHLRNPFLAAQETFDVLRNGGYVYGDCNFVFAYHGYPHHYFNASEQGLEQAFSQFEKLRTGVAPYQMPSFALLMVLLTYLSNIGPSPDPEVEAYKKLLQKVLDQPLRDYDALFTEQAALNVAAGVFYFGRKALPGTSDVVPQVIQDIYELEPELKQRFPNLFNLGTINNILLWAKQEGRHQFGAIDDYFQKVVPFRKSETVGDEGQKAFDAMSILDPTFATIPEGRQGTLLDEADYSQRVAEQWAEIQAKNAHIKRLERHIQRLESGRVMRLLGRVRRNRANR